MIVSGMPRDSAFTLAYALSAVGRRKYLLALPTLAGLGFALAGYATTPYSFVSESVVALDVRRVALPTDTVVSPLPQDSPVLRTEVDIINSRSMAAKVVARLEREGVVIRDDEQPAISPATLRRFVTSLLQASAHEQTSELPQVVSDEDRIKVDRLLSRLRVSNDGRSYTIFLTFSSSDPIFAAKVSNAYALTYLDHQIDIQRNATRRVSDWLGETLVNLRADLETSEQAAENFRQKAGLIETNGAILQAQRVAALNSELANTRAVFSGLEARLATIKSLSSEHKFPSLAEILGSETIQALRIEQARSERRLRELQDSRALKSAEIASLRSELDSIGRQIGDEVARIVASLTNEISIARQKEASLTDALRDAQEELSEANHAEVTLAQLEREAAANRTIYESYLVRYKQTIEQDGIAAPEAQIISFAEPASRPAKPRLAAWVMFGLGLGGSLGIAALALREATDRRPRVVDTLEHATGVPVIGALPQMGRRERKRVDAIMRDSGTRMGRALAGLRRVLRIDPTRKFSSVIVITSSCAGEGKTTLALGMARSAAAAGIRTVVVDADLRRPGVAKALDLRPGAFVDELLTGERSVDELLHEARGAGFSAVVARSGAARPELLLASPRFRTLINELKLRFDLVLIDAPETSAAPDAMEISAFARRVLFVTRFSTRRMDPVIASIRTLVAWGHGPDGIVLNGVDRRSYRRLTEQLVAAATRRVEGPAIPERETMSDAA